MRLGLTYCTAACYRALYNPPMTCPECGARPGIPCACADWDNDGA